MTASDEARIPEPDPAALRRRAEVPERLLEALGGHGAFLVGGAVRDLILGARHPDLDVVVEGDAPAIARELGAATTHDRFATATVDLDRTRIDLATARTEAYPRPGALPEVEPATLREDLARRDFTINAMAIPLTGPADLIDPHGGLADLRAALIRVLHASSFVDDPTRALRAARYAARLGFALEPETARLAAAADLGTVSADRTDAELGRLAAEESAPQGFELLAELGLAGADRGVGARLRAVRDVLARPGWSELVAQAEAVHALGVPDPELESAAVSLSAARPSRPSEAVALTRGRSPLELVAARVAGAGWLDDYVQRWRAVTLEIGGEDLIASGVPEGRAVGRGLAAALNAKLDGEASGREEELRVALEAARAT